jgi:signal transduction histidine kinase
VLRSTETTLFEPQPVLDDLAGLVRDAREAGVDVTFDPLPGARVPPAVGLAAFRIAQEALSNARRHAAGAPVHILLTLGPSTLELYVRNASGPPADIPAGDAGGERHGLLGMRERATAIGGTFDAGPDPVGGYTVRATLPLEVTA